MKYSRLIRAIDIPLSHLINDMAEYDQLLEILSLEENKIEDMRDEDEKELKHEKDQILQNKRNNLPSPDIHTVSDNYNTEV